MLRKNYEDLFKYFKTLVAITTTFIAIITGISGYFFWKDRSDLQGYVEDLKNNAEESISRMEESSSYETEQLKNEMKTVVDREVKRELDNIFVDQNISELIKEKVRQEINLHARDLIQIEVNQMIQESEAQLSEVMEINDAALRMRIGHFEGYKELMRLVNEAKFLSNKSRANRLFERIQNDYILFFNKYHVKQIKKDEDVEYYLKELDIKNDDDVITNLVEYILEEHNLDHLNLAIVLLNQKARTSFIPFQFEEIREWVQKTGIVYHLRRVKVSHPRRTKVSIVGRMKMSH
ncbi:MAG: hypothetical protein ACX93O_00005 [Flagellimonas sp.]